MSELVKLISCLWLVYHEEGNSISKLKEAVHTQIIKQPLDTLKVCVPSMVYVVQNNLLYVAASHLDAATYQVSLKKKTISKFSNF
jgi:UDP-sugar transporter A1/2/3